MAWSLVVLVGLLLLLEGTARWLDPRIPAWQGEDSHAVVMTGHPQRLWGLSAGKRTNAGTIATITTDGLRVPVPEGPRDPGVERIMVLGDSTFFGYGVPDDASIAALLEQRLGPNIQAINGGIPGYSTAQTERLMADVGWDLDPTLLLIGSFWSDTNYAAYPDAELLKTRDAASQGLLHRSALARLLAGRLRLGGVVSWTRFDELPDPTRRRVPVQAFAAALDRLIRAAAQRGIGAALLAPPAAVEVTGQARPPHHWTAYLDAQAQIARHHDIPHIEHTTDFRAHFLSHKSKEMLFIDDLHPTKLGLSAMATRVTLDLRSHDWPTQRLIGKGTAPFSVDSLVDGMPTGHGHAPDRSPMSNLFPHQKTKASGPPNQPGQPRPTAPLPAR